MRSTRQRSSRRKSLYSFEKERHWLKATQNLGESVVSGQAATPKHRNIKLKWRSAVPLKKRSCRSGVDGQCDTAYNPVLCTSVRCKMLAVVATPAHLRAEIQPPVGS
eukprot:5083477-Pleurochrysis_carterae.AAC.1